MRSAPGRSAASIRDQLPTSAIDFLHAWVVHKVTLLRYSTIQPCTYTADVTTFGTGAEGIRRKQEAARFGEQQPQRRSLSAPEPHRDTVLM